MKLTVKERQVILKAVDHLANDIYQPETICSAILRASWLDVKTYWSTKHKLFRFYDQHDPSKVWPNAFSEYRFCGSWPKSSLTRARQELRVMWLLWFLEVCN